MMVTRLPDRASLDAAYEAAWAENAHKIGEWELWPATGEVRYAGRIVGEVRGQEAQVLEYLMQRWPNPARTFNIESDLLLAPKGAKVLVHHLRRQFGAGFIVSKGRVYSAYTFNPEASPCVA